MRYTHDKLGRVKFTSHTLNPTDLIPRTDHVKWMQFINLHGPVSSHYLLALTPKNAHNHSEQLKRLFDGGYIYKPVQQRETEYPDGHFHVYDLTDKGKAYLKENGLWIEAVRPTGKWLHQFMVASITASIHLECIRAGYRYIPPHEYLNGQRLGADVPFDWNGRKTLPLVPDAVFAIDYGNNSYIAYFLEADRNTEPQTAKAWDRKSDKRTILQYASFIGGKLYKQAYKREAKAVLLFITVDEYRAQGFLRQVAEHVPNCKYMAVGVEDAFKTPFYTPKVLSHLFREELRTVGGGYRIQKEDPA